MGRSPEGAQRRRPLMTRGRGRRRQRGMFLPALLVLGALGAVGWLLSHQTSAASRQLRQDMQTAHALAVAREALIGFAATYRSKEHPDADFGYLPCPDLDGDGSSETCGTKDQASVGRLPYLTLNLPDLRDGAGECLWYAVAGSVKNNPKPDVLNWDSTGRFRLHDTGGTAIALPGDQTGLAAALVIASQPRLAVLAAKEAVNRAFEAPLSEGLLAERRLFHALFATANQKEGMAAFIAKRPAQFTGQ